MCNGADIWDLPSTSRLSTEVSLQYKIDYALLNKFR